MSQYQYYEFQSLDGPINDAGLRYAEGCSSRAEVSRFRWCNVYNYGSFRGSVELFLEHYDAYFHISNWGSLCFALAFPEGSLDVESAEPYFQGDGGLCLSRVGGRCIVHWDRYDEDDSRGWVEGAGMLDRLVGVRTQLMGGDFRALFLGWLADFYPDGWSADSKVCVPPVPAGLGSLDSALRELVEQLCIDPDVFAVAVSLSGKLKAERIPMGAVLDQLSVAEMRTLLERVANGEGVRVGAELNRQACLPAGTGETSPLECADFARRIMEFRDARLKQEALEAAAGRRRAAAERKRYLELVMERAEAIWNELDPLMEQKFASVYDAVAARLEELRDAYRLHGREAEFRERLDAFQSRYERRPAMIRRIEEMDADDER